VYSGYKKVHGLKYLTVVIPSGIIAACYGPFSGRVADAQMLVDSV
jgi:hypothetical protein